MTPASGVGPNTRVRFDSRGWSRDGMPHLFESVEDMGVKTALCGRQVRILTVWAGLHGESSLTVCARCSRLAEELAALAVAEYQVTTFPRGVGKSLAVTS